jgi:Eco57I restriction-modification methylase/TaqI-like C-terminal specificity domain
MSPSKHLQNLSLPLNEPRPDTVSKAVAQLATSNALEDRGAVFTKSGVVDAMLDLCGYTSDADLEGVRLLEPSFGDGDFLLSAVRRLVASFRRRGIELGTVAQNIRDSVRGVEVHHETFNGTCHRVEALLVESGVTEEQASDLVKSWLVNDDFLLADLGTDFDVVVGNPPYVRQERIPGPLLREYKKRYTTLYDRADLYILFFERGLDLLREEGRLGFICANRWLKNKYGGPLRHKICDSFALRYFIDLERADAFHAEVDAYPAITVIQRSSARRCFVALNNRETATGLGAVAEKMIIGARDGALVDDQSEIGILVDVARGRDPWLLDAPEILPALRSLEQRFPSLEDAGAKVGIGVATGADKVFIGDYDELPVEDTRKLRLAMAADCSNGDVSWGGRGVVNPYMESGQLAPLSEYPRFAHYMEAHADALKRRHTARKSPNKWYKTIDRIYPQLTAQSKLLIPDIKGDATVAYDDGFCYPHHNLYVVTSDEWNLRALQTLLRSSVAMMFVASYCVRMSGGFLRFQAQYLRRIRCPRWSDLSEASQASLVEVSSSKDQGVLDSAVWPVYGLRESEIAAIAAFADAARVVKKGA